MRVTASEVLLHFRTNPISTLVAMLLLLLFGLVLRFIYHIDVEMHRNVLVHDEVQHLQIKEAYLAKQLQRSIADLQQFVADFGIADQALGGLVLGSAVEQLCSRRAQYARVQRVTLSGSQDRFDRLCITDYSVQVDANRVMPAVMSGVALELLGQQQYSLERQAVRVIMPELSADGEIRARWMVDLLLTGLPKMGSESHNHTSQHDQAHTMLLEAQSPWRGEQAKHDMARGAVFLSSSKLSEPGVFQNEYGLYVVQPVIVSEAQGQTPIAAWRLLSWTPQKLFVQQQYKFLLHASYVVVAFVLLICAMFLYSRRVIRNQADMLNDLNNQRNFLDGLLNSSSDGMLSLAMNGEIISCNVRSETLFGFRPGELIGRSIEHLLPSDYQTCDQDYPRIYRQLSESDQSDYRQELVGVRQEGEDFPVEVSYCQLQMDGEDRLLLIIREITGRKAAQKELDNLRMQYFQQEKMAQIGLLMAGILHEVGNPIAAIQGLVDEVLADDAAKQQALLSTGHRANLELVLQQANRIRTISQDISGFASPHQHERGLLSLNAILVGTSKLLGYDKRWRNLELVMELDAQLPAIEGVADQLTQVFMNLLVNAADALDGVSGRQPQLVVSSCKLADGVLLVSIKDNGCGIDDDIMRHIFDSFYTTKPKGKGTGLGLSICEKLIEDHNGQLELESVPNQGTEVRIYFEYDY